ncbi:MAG TPA: hypothetical protein DEA96_17935 [Leptospiraceae bacterium]|nr:hypothetical protein [Spirochaetaceae bacterium]HBS06856.1 hypothetical protein [Leptospiraceae bacterium]|tara:strand:- start:26418 stop:27563 length:1146 start_codon:yes stop_codon:yes gene_type:complete
MHRIGISLIAILLLACQQNTSQVEKQNPEEAQYSEWHERALFLAGLPTSEEFRKKPEVARIIRLPHYQDHVRQMNAFWTTVDQKRVAPMTAWWRAELSPRMDGIKTDTALYPLSGGDLLNFKLIYPDAKRYIMIAMEKPGRMPAPDSMTDPQLQEGLYSVRKMLGNIALTGYFFSRWMNWYMNPEKYGFYGTLPTVSVFLVRLGHRIESVDQTCINEQGKLVTESNPCYLPGYRISFIDGNTDEKKELFYHSTRIDNDLFSESTARGRYIQSLGKVAVMMKAAVYLFHRPAHQAGAQYLLEHSEVIVQDDSGIPYGRFDRDRWDITLYGTYRYPLPGMGVYPQQDLIRAYGQGSEHLPFAYGYGPKTAARASGLMVAFSRR